MSATPEQFMSTFELYGDGQAVLDSLTQTFGGPLFSTDALEMARRVGQREVIEHIHGEIAKAEKPARARGAA